ncbi:MAG: hypothetical protein ACFE0Q_07785 [Anaerolineae bacterium]
MIVEDHELDAAQGEQLPRSRGWWGVIRRLFVSDDTQQQQRMYALNQAIETYPDAAVNYVIRGELYLEKHRYDLARQDFETALDHLTQQTTDDRWGITTQALQDRACHGLQRCE